MTTEEKAKAYDEALEEQNSLCASGTAEPDYGICDDYIPATLHFAMARHGWYACHVGEEEGVILQRKKYVERNWSADKDNLTQEQKPAEWSEEDTLMLTAIIQTLERFGGRGTTGMQIDWLKSLRPPKDCSGCAKHLEGYISGRGDAENKLLEQFGILITPEGELHMKPRWKPSEEQMEALDRCVDYLDESNNEDAGIIESLYEHLKKLM